MRIEVEETAEGAVVAVRLNRVEKRALSRHSGAGAGWTIRTVVEGALGEIIERGKRGLKVDRLVTDGSLEIGRG